MSFEGPASRAGGRAWAGAVLAILALAAVLRVHDLGDLPPGLFCDEAGLGYNAYSILKTGRGENGDLLPLYVWSFGVSYKNPVFIYAAMLPIALFGLSDFSVRLTAAVFGVLGVLAAALLGRLWFGRAGGVLAALLLALCPWHLHFSRIAFELITFPTVFLFALAALVGGLRRPRLLPAAGLLFSLSLYTYVPAKSFVPAFLLGVALAYRRRLWVLRRSVAAALLVAALTAGPLLIFDLRHFEQSRQYFRQTTTMDASQPAAENLRRLFVHYQYFFSPAFLLTHGDPITRHAVPGFGELQKATAPLLLIGLLWALVTRRAEGKLLLWWLFLYPIAAALMNEIPSASRSIIGAPGFCLLAAAGGAAALRLFERRPAARFVLALGGGLLLGAMAMESWRYWRVYRTRYPAQAAADFQYGYRETVRFMEERRSSYDLLLLTANNVNQPQIFTAFYTEADPRRWQRTENAGYLILDPAEYGRYHMNQRLLAAVRESDLYLFADYRELHRVVTPAGGVEFVIIDAKTRRRFLTDWLILGPFENPHGAGITTDYVQPEAPAPRGYTGSVGAVYWRRIRPPFVRVDLNLFYGETLRRAGRAPEWLCGYALAQVESAAAAAAQLELRGPFIPARAWWNGRALTPAPIQLSTDPTLLPIELGAGANELLVNLCKTTGDWHFSARITDASGRDLDGVEMRPELAAPSLGEGAAVVEPRQLLDGLGAVLSYPQHADRHPDYRGESAAWWERLADPDGAVTWETEPCPEHAATAFAFTAALGEEQGRAELWINGRYALSFPTGKFSAPQRWTRAPFRLEYYPQESGQFLSGYWLLYVPEEEVSAGRPLELRVAHNDGSPHAFFMLMDRHDTIAHEGLTLERIGGAAPSRPLGPAAGPRGDGDA
jgi:4-amino-4-deoxy-L-arabinose transferase-like glycosyltransferase